MIDALHEEMPAGCRYEVPRSGVFIWIELPEGGDATKLLALAVRNGVMALPGKAFVTHADSYFQSCLRLNFSSNPPNRIREGIGRLAVAIKQ